GGTAPKGVVVVEDGKKEIVLDAATGKIREMIEKQPATARFTTGEGDGNTVHLTRVTYSLSGDQAHALQSFLRENARASVLETKVDGDKLIVTTTPDVQATIGQVVGLTTGKTGGSGARYYYRTTPTPMTPGTPKLELPRPKSSNPNKSPEKK